MHTASQKRSIAALIVWHCVPRSDQLGCILSPTQRVSFLIDFVMYHTCVARTGPGTKMDFMHCIGGSMPLSAQRYVHVSMRCERRWFVFHPVQNVDPIEAAHITFMRCSTSVRSRGGSRLQIFNYIVQKVNNKLLNTINVERVMIVVKLFLPMRRRTITKEGISHRKKLVSQRQL